MEYDMFVRFPTQIVEGKEIIVHVRDTANYESKVFKAKIYKGKRELETGQHRLLVRTPLGVIREEAWTLETLKELDAECLTSAQCFHCAMLASQGVQGEAGE